MPNPVNIPTGALMPDTTTSSSADTLQPQNLPQAAPDQTAMTSTATPLTPNDATKYVGHSFLTRAIAPVVNAAGGDTTYNVDDQGKLQESVVNATPGTLFKHLLVGALSGLGAAASHPGQMSSFAQGMGAGVGAGMNQVQNQDELARQHAIQSANLQQKAQAAKDTHSEAVSANAARDAETAFHNGQTGALAYTMAQKSQEFQDNVFTMDRANRDDLLKNGGVTTHSQIDGDQAQDLIAKDKSLGHTEQAFVTGETPVLGPDNQPIMEPKLDIFKRPMLDAKGQPLMAPKMKYLFDVVQTPDDHTLTPKEVKTYSKMNLPGFDMGTVKPGQTISGAQWMNLRNQARTQQIADLNEEEIKSNIAAHRAAASTASAQGASIALDIADKKERKQVSDDWNSAVQQANGDTEKANDIFWKNTPKSAAKMYSAQEEAIDANGGTETSSSLDGTTKTVKQVVQRLINPPGQSGGARPETLTLAAPPPGMVTIQAPGHAPMSITPDKLPEFLSKNPHGVYRKTGNGPAAATSAPVLSQRPQDVQARAAVGGAVRKVANLVNGIPTV